MTDLAVVQVSMRCVWRTQVVETVLLHLLYQEAACKGEKLTNDVWPLVMTNSGVCIKQ